MTAAKSTRHWDPFEGAITVETPDTAHIRKGIALPLWLKRLPMPLALAAMLWTVAAAVLAERFPVLPVIVTTLGFALVFLVEHLENADGRRTLRRVALARERGWSYTGAQLEWVMERIVARDGDGDFDRRSQRVKPERLLKIEAHLPELTRMQAGAFMGARLDGEFWGESADGLPLWIAVGATRMEAGLGPRAMRRDAHGGTGGFGQFFSLLGAYRIDRATGIRAVISPENLFSKGPLDRDIKTESTAFNEAFRVAGHRLARGGGTGNVAQDVLQILTPATQTTLLDLKARFHTVGFVVDDDVLFFMAQDKLSGVNASEGGIDRLLPQIIDEFEAAKRSLKAYVE